MCRAQPGVALAAAFVDAPYHRSSVSLVSRSAGALADAVVALADAALAAIDLRRHDATHPRLGALDHVSCQPVPPGLSSASDLAGPTAVETSPGGSVLTRLLDGSSGCDAGSSSSNTSRSTSSSSSSSTGDADADADAAAAMRDAAALARDIGERLAGGRWRLPVYLYGAAHPQGRRLADVRRSLGYFGANAGGGRAWAGAAIGGGGDLSGCPPDLGPSAATASAGVATVGAVPWVVNFNVPLSGGGSGSGSGSGGSSIDLAAARRVARAVSERGGGLAGVEAMALAHQGGVVEVACNVLAPAVSTPLAVQAAIEAAAAAEGLGVQRGASYVIGRLPPDVIAMAEAAGV